MLRELRPGCYAFGFGGAVIRLRYDLNALLEAERGGVDLTAVMGGIVPDEGLSALFRAGIIGDEIKARAAEIADALGEDKVREHCRAAVLLSLPKSDPLIIPTGKKSAEPLDFKRLRTLVCDVMRKPEEFFWTSTIGELCERWTDYAVEKGYAKRPERMEMFDTEGMDDGAP